MESGKAGFVNFKNAIYHEAFKVFLEKITQYSYTGSNTKCGDNVHCVLWPFVHILLADYEELYILSF
jgi:hypothetical protein